MPAAKGNRLVLFRDLDHHERELSVFKHSKGGGEGLRPVHTAKRDIKNLRVGFVRTRYVRAAFATKKTGCRRLMTAAVLGCRWYS